MMSALQTEDPEIFDLICLEDKRQKQGLELIASENYVSQAVLEAVGSILTNKYAEGYPGARYYGGCEYNDEVEKLAIERAKKLFGADHVNVQPHSGANANLAIYFATTNPGDTVLAMSLDHGGHLTHGSKVNFSGRLYHIVSYGVCEDTNLIDYDQVEQLALSCRPKLIIAGASAYPRVIDFERFSQIAKLVGAKLWVDMAHIAGLVATGLHPSPVPHADFVTTTTHKTLRGPRGGMILCKAEHQKLVDSRMFPGFQGGPLMHVIAGKAVCFHEALKPEFKTYQSQVLKNAKVLAEELLKRDFKLVSGGTDNHLMLVDLRNKNITGKQATEALGQAHMVVNKNQIPFDTASPQVTSGIRLGTPALTTRGMKEPEMRLVAGWITDIIDSQADETVIARVGQEVLELTNSPQSR